MEAIVAIFPFFLALAVGGAIVEAHEKRQRRRRAELARTLLLTRRRDQAIASALIHERPIH